MSLGGASLNGCCERRPAGEAAHARVPGEAAGKGSDALVSALRTLLDRAGVDDDVVRREEFHGY
jgi:hypothetical protein